MKVRTLVVKCDGVGVQNRFARPLVVPDNIDLLSILDRHAREILKELIDKAVPPK